MVVRPANDNVKIGGYVKMTDHRNKVLLLRGAIAASAEKILMDVEAIQRPGAELSVIQFFLCDVARLAINIKTHLDAIDCHLEAILSSGVESNPDDEK